LLSPIWSIPEGIESLLFPSPKVTRTPSEASQKELKEWGIESVAPFKPAYTWSIPEGIERRSRCQWRSKRHWPKHPRRNWKLHHMPSTSLLSHLTSKHPRRNWKIIHHRPVYHPEPIRSIPEGIESWRRCRYVYGGSAWRSIPEGIESACNPEPHQLHILIRSIPEGIESSHLAKEVVKNVAEEASQKELKGLRH